MKRNLLLIFAILFSLFLLVNSAQRLFTFRGTSEKIEEADTKLTRLMEENEELKLELEYKQSEEYKEQEIRNKLGLVKEGETIVIVPRDDSSKSQETSEDDHPNWVKWKNLFFGDS